MPLGRFEKVLVAATLAGAAFVLAPGSARADGPVSPTGKGIVGGTLLGGEVVTITMAAIGVERGWPYFVFGAVGAGGGAVGGYFVEKATKNGGGSAAPELVMLAGGMALVIPALVLSLNATAYKPPDSDRIEPVNNRPAKDPPAPGQPPGPGARALPHIPMALFDVYKGRVAPGIPAVELKPLYSQQEMAQYGVSQGTETRIPVFKATF